MSATAITPATETVLPLCACGCGEQVKNAGARYAKSSHTRLRIGRYAMRPEHLDAPMTSVCAWCDTAFTGRAEDVLREHAEHRDTCTAKPEQVGPTRIEKLQAMKRDRRDRQDLQVVRETSTYKRIAELRAQAVPAPQIAVILTEEGYGDWTARAIWAYAAKYNLPPVAKKPPAAPAPRVRAAERPELAGRDFASASERRAAITDIVRDALAVGLSAARTAERLNAAEIRTAKGNLWRPVSTYAVMTRVRAEQQQQAAA